MGCFHVQKPKKQPVTEEDEPRPYDPDPSSPSSSPRPALSAPPSFRRTARIIQNAQRFISQSNPKLRSSHPSYGTRENRSDNTYPSDMTTLSKPMPLPSPLLSPQLSPKPTGYYVLPPPAEHTPTSPKPENVDGRSVSPVVHGALNTRVVPWDVQPLPPPKAGVLLPRTLDCFTFDDLSTACQQFSHQNLVGDDGMSYKGVIKTGLKGSKQQEVIVMRVGEVLFEEVEEWVCELSDVYRLHSPHLCKLLGLCTANGATDHYLVYEQLQRGSLHNLLLNQTESPPLDWHTRMKIVHCAAQGLASLHEIRPKQILYRDFRLSHIQVDSDFNAKICGYFPISSIQLSNSPSTLRENAYCAPEVIKEGMITLKSHVWSFGVVLLEILCGRKNVDKRLAKDEKHNLVKWAKPFLQEEDKLFLIMDPKLHGRFPSKGSKIIGNLILRCLQKDPVRRPTMKAAVGMLKAALERHDHPYMTSVTWKEVPKKEAKAPVSAPLRSLKMSQSLKPGNMESLTLSYNRSPTKFDLVQSPQLRPLIIPSRICND